MAEKILNTRQKQKYDTSTNWTTNNPILLAGELGFESDTNKFKIGNGTSSWNDLSYVSVDGGGGSTILYSTTGQNTDGAMTQKAVTDSLPQAVEITASTGQPSVTSEQFTKLLESPDNYIILTMSQQDDVGNLAKMNIKLTRADHTKLTVGTLEQDLLLFTGVYEGSSELSSVLSLLLSRFSNTPDEIEVSSSSVDYATQSDIPTALSQLSEDANHRLVTDTEKSTWNAKSDFSGSYNDLINKPNLFSGNYNDLTDKPTIPTSLSELTEDSAHRLVTDTEKTTWNAKSDFSGSYNDLTNKPTISTINVDGQPQSTLNFDSDPQTQITQNTQDIEALQNEKIQSITLTASQGTLTDEQFNILTSSDKNYIVFITSGASLIGGSYQRTYKLYRSHILNYGNPTPFTSNSLNYFSGLHGGFYYYFSVNPDTKQYSITNFKVDTIREDGEVEHGTSNQNGYYHYWYKIYSDGTIVVHGVYYTNTDAEITIPFNNFSFRSVDYFRCAFGSIDNAEYSNGAFAKDVQTTYITFKSRSAAQWYSFYLYEQGL